MIRRTIALFAYMILCGISTPSLSAELTGAWQIHTQGGPVPLCNFVQIGNNLKGSCVGPYAAGIVTGAVDGQTVRWRWQWITYTGGRAAGFDFFGTLAADRLTGVVERREIGMSLNFTAERQAPLRALPEQSLPNFQGASGYPINSFQDAQNYYAQGPSPAVIASARQISPDLTNLSDAKIRHRLIPEYTRQGMQHGDWVDAPSSVIIPGPVPSRSLQETWNTNEQALNTGNSGINPEIEARSWKLYPFASQQSERVKYIVDEMNSAADRQRGNSFFIRIR